MSQMETEVLDALERLAQHFGESEARGVVQAIARPAIRDEFERVVARRLAARLLAQREPRPAIRDRLVARGITWRTAYRVIESVLSGGPLPRCDTAGPPVTASAGSLPTLTPQPSEQSVPQTAQDLSERLQHLNRELERHDLPAQRRRVELTEAERQRCDADSKTVKLGGGDDAREKADALVRASLAATDASRQFNRVEQLVLPLRREAERLRRILSGEQRAEQAQEMVTAAATQVRDAQQKVTSCEAAVATVDQMILEERRAVDNARGAAAAKLLQAIKAGNDASKVVAASTDKMATLELARAAAVQELDAARAALKDAQGSRSSALRELLAARADHAELQHHLALTGYVEVLAAYLAAQSRAQGRPSTGIEDPRTLALPIVQAMLASDGA